MKKNNSKKGTNLLKITVYIIIIFIAVLAIIFSLNILSKTQNKNKENEIAQNNEIILSNHKVLYIDLTKNPNDYIKITEQQKKIENNFNNSKPTNTNIQDKSEKNNTKVNNNTQESNEVNNSSLNVDKSLIIETSNISDIEKAGNTQSIVKVAEKIYCIHYNSKQDAEDGYNSLKNNSEIINIGKNELVYALENNTQEKEEIFKEQSISGNNYAWGTETTGLGRFLKKVSFNKNAKSVKVAVLDTGVRTTHEIFKNEKTADKLDLTNSYNYIDKNKNIDDIYGHGTKVAGIIAQSTSNNVKIVPIKVLGANGYGSVTNLLEAVAAVKDNVDIINLSLGLDKTKVSKETLELTEKVFKEVHDNNKIIICAAGNNGEKGVFFPACSKYTIAVSAITSNNEIASFSNYGEDVDFSAPGKDLILPNYTGDNLYNVNFPSDSNEYKMRSGTSFSAPFVASAVALIKSENSTYTIEDIIKVLKENSEDLGAPGKDIYFGYGAINFDISMFKKPVIISTNLNKNDENHIYLEADAVGGHNITDWCCIIAQKEPSESSWKKVKTPAKYQKITETLLANEDINIWLKDENGNITKQFIKISDSKIGDLNEDNKIDSIDVLIILRYIAQLNNVKMANKHNDWNLSEEKLKNADVFKDNKVDIIDVLKLQRYIAATSSKQIAEKHPDWLDVGK